VASLPEPSQLCWEQASKSRRTAFAVRDLQVAKVDAHAFGVCLLAVPRTKVVAATVALTEGFVEVAAERAFELSISGRT
jgi:hypothetical protein